jgi:hypothetical protein
MQESADGCAKEVNARYVILRCGHNEGDEQQQL